MKPRSVLLIDDDRAFRALAARMLEAAGLVVVAEAATCASGLAAAADMRPDAALVDVWLPDGNGVQLARQLAALPWRPRIVLTSSDPDAATPASARRAGAIGFVPKSDLPDGAAGRMLAGT